MIKRYFLLWFLPAKKVPEGAGDAAQSAECFPGMHEALGLSPALHKPAMVPHAYNPSICKVEAEGPGVQDETKGLSQQWRTHLPITHENLGSVLTKREREGKKSQRNECRLITAVNSS